MHPRDIDGQSVLRIESVRVRFGGIVALKGLSLDVYEGEVVGLIGPNGSGKTTLLNCITGLYHPESGAIHFQGKNLTRMATNRIIRGGIARTFQNPSLFPTMSVIDNVCVARRCCTPLGIVSSALALPAARRVERGIVADAEKILSFLGLEAAMGAKPSDLPVGLARLADLARALALEPRLLLLDEPAAGMNPTEKGHLAKIIATLARDRQITIILVEHDMGFVMGIAHRLCVLNFGTKIAEGRPKEIQQNPHVIEAYLGRQSQLAETG